MTYALHNFDIGAEYTPRPVKRCATNTNPLQLSAVERKALNNIIALFEGTATKKGLINTPSSGLSQIKATYAAIVGIDSILSNNIGAAVQTALLGLRDLAEIQGVSPFIFEKRDGASRNLVPDERIALKDLAFRLAAATEPKNDVDQDRARCLRAMVCAAIAAERGLIHIAAENFGVVISTIYSDHCRLRSSVEWTDELRGYAVRWSRAIVKMP